MRIGCRAHDFGCLPAVELAARIADAGVSCVQLAPFKALTEFAAGPESLTADTASAVGAAFAVRDIGVSILGCYINPIHPDSVERRRLLDLFKQHLQLAKNFGNDLVALETGSVNADYSPHPDNQGEVAFNSMVESIAELVQAAEECGVRVGVEAVTVHTVSTPAKMKRLLDIIASESIRVVFDPVNLIDVDNSSTQGDVFQECFDLFGDKIEVLHIKNFEIENGAVGYLPPGDAGLLDNRMVFEWLKSNKPSIDVLMEEVVPDTIDESMNAIKRFSSDDLATTVGRVPLSGAPAR